MSEKVLAEGDASRAEPPPPSFPDMETGTAHYWDKGHLSVSNLPPATTARTN